MKVNREQTPHLLNGFDPKWWGLVEKPSRYIGGEIGSVVKERASARIALVFPDLYDIAMSNLGLMILYEIINDRSEWAAERAYAPAPDMERLLREESVPLGSLETGRPLVDFDAIGVTLQYDLCATNLLTMLDLGGVPLTAAERKGDDPIVIGGGPVAFNPDPWADFFDLFALGDGEEMAVDIMQVLEQANREGWSRETRIQRLKEIEGVMDPRDWDYELLPGGRIGPMQSHSDRPMAERRFLPDLETAPYITRPVVPYTSTTFDRYTVEISRGCTRGCKFCYAGMIYRSVRERSPQRVAELMEQGLAHSGFSEISLSSLSAGDYRHPELLLSGLERRFGGIDLSLSFPSMRVGTLSGEKLDHIAEFKRHSSFTLAPEAGTQRLRDLINKPDREEEILAQCEEVFASGQEAVKLYFMIGLPSETDEDLQGIVDLAVKIRAQGRKHGKRPRVTVSVSTFVPKPHTPFQWVEQLGSDEVRRRQRLLRDAFARLKIEFRWHDDRLSWLEGVFSRGDRRLGKAILAAYRRGARFDGWGEHYDQELWKAAFHEVGVVPEDYFRARDLDEPFPWDYIDAGPTRDFMRKEFKKVSASIPKVTEDCRDGPCLNCGVQSPHEGCHHLPSDRPASSEPLRFYPAMGRAPSGGVSASGDVLAVQLSIRGAMRYLSQQERSVALMRAVRRAGIPVAFSKGFNPTPNISFGVAVATGIASTLDLAYIELQGGEPLMGAAIRLQQQLPQGMDVRMAWRPSTKASMLGRAVGRALFRVTGLPLSKAEMGERLASIVQRDVHIQKRNKKGRVQEIPIAEHIVVSRVLGDGAVLMGLKMSEGSGLRIQEVLEAALVVPRKAILEADIVRVGLLYSEVDPTRTEEGGCFPLHIGISIEGCAA